MALDPVRGRVIVAGTQGPGAMDLGGGARTHASPYSGFVAALDANDGSWIWDAMMAGSGSGGSHAHGVAVDPASGEVVTTGIVYGAGTIYLCGARSAASTGGDGVIFRLRADGTCRWGAQYSNAGHGATGYVFLTSVALDPTGGSYAMVHYERGLRRQPYGGGFSIPSLGGYDVAVLSHAADGTERWTAPTTVAITSQGDDAQLATASDGTLWIAGHYRDAEVAYVERIVDGGTSGTRAGHVNANPPGQDVVRGVAAFHADQPVVVGFYSSAGFSAEGDTLGYSGGPSDGFIWRHQATIP